MEYTLSNSSLNHVAPMEVLDDPWRPQRCPDCSMKLVSSGGCMMCQGCGFSYC